MPKSYADQMISHAQEEAPNECCGLLAGKDDSIVKLYRTTNVEHSPFRYNVDPKELLAIWREVDQNDWEFLGIYHSHTASPAYPSPTDVRLAAWPDALYFIVSLADPDKPLLRGFHIRDGNVTEEDLEVR